MSEPEATKATEGAKPARPKDSRAALFPSHYGWYLIIATMDVMLTHRILKDFVHVGGREVNPIAEYFIRQMGYGAAVALKYSTVIVVILVCESVGRKHSQTGRSLATAAVVLSALPVAWGLLQLALFALR